MTAVVEARRCPQCGALLAGAATVEDLCSTCLLSQALSQDEIPTEAAFDPRREAGSGAAVRLGARARTLSPVGTGLVAPTWAMPVELLRQAARRLRVAAFGGRPSRSPSPSG